MTDLEIVMDIYNCDEEQAKWRMSESTWMHVLVKGYRAGYEKGLVKGYDKCLDRYSDCIIPYDDDLD